jgi:hypothetical protein
MSQGIGSGDQGTKGPDGRERELRDRLCDGSRGMINRRMEMRLRKLEKRTERSLDELSDDELLAECQKAITACGGPEALAELRQDPAAAEGYARVMACRSGREFIQMDLSAGELALRGRQHRPEVRRS